MFLPVCEYELAFENVQRICFKLPPTITVRGRWPRQRNGQVIITMTARDDEPLQRVRTCRFQSGVYICHDGADAMPYIMARDDRLSLTFDFTSSQRVPA